jgi:hypothetical protein
MIEHGDGFGKKSEYEAGIADKKGIWKQLSSAILRR